MIIALGALVGLVLGLTGAGGGILAVPALMLSQGWGVAQAAPVALLAVAAGAWTGTFDGLRRGLARYRAAMVMALAALPTTALGLALAQHVPARVLTGLFALVMVVVAVRTLRGRGAAGDESEQVICRVDGETGRFVWTPVSFMAITGFGALAGLLTGLLGVGGGFVIVPVLRRYTELSMAAVVATALMVVALVSTSSVAMAWYQGGDLPLALALPFILAVVAGMILGRMLAPRLSPQRSLQAFAWLLLAVAGVLLARLVWPV